MSRPAWPGLPVRFAPRVPPGCPVAVGLTLRNPSRRSPSGVEFLLDSPCSPARQWSFTSGRTAARCAVIVCGLLSPSCAGRPAVSPVDTGPTHGVVVVHDGSGGLRPMGADLGRAVADFGLHLKVLPFEWSHGAGRVFSDLCGQQRRPSGLLARSRRRRHPGLTAGGAREAAHVAVAPAAAVARRSRRSSFSTGSGRWRSRRSCWQGLRAGRAVNVHYRGLFVDRRRRRAHDGPAAGVFTGRAAGPNSCTNYRAASGQDFAQGTEEAPAG